VQPVEENFNNLEEWVTVSPVLTLEPNNITFNKPVTVAIPVPVYSGSSKSDIQASLRLLCCFPKDTTNEPKTPTYQWQDITDSTPLTVMGDTASFTINRPARLVTCLSVCLSVCLFTDYREGRMSKLAEFLITFSEDAEAWLHK